MLFIDHAYPNLVVVACCFEGVEEEVREGISFWRNVFSSRSRAGTKRHSVCQRLERRICELGERRECDTRFLLAMH